MSKKRLGKGLSALINSDDNIDQSRIDEIFIDQIEANPYQPRSDFDEDALKELAKSIEEKGVIQPITVRKIKAEKYQIVAGERRWRASRLVGLKKMPAVIRDFDDQEMLEIALIENIQREDLNPIEEAAAYKEMLENFEITQAELAKQVGKSRSNVSNMIRLLKLDDKVKNYLQQDAITIGHARALLALENNKTQIAACENIIIQDLTVRETEKYIDKLKNPFKNQKNKQKKEELEPIWQEAAAELEKKLKTKVKIKKRKKNNLIQIEIESIEKLNDLLEKL
ncbi:ParB/RepB/Spo0J family partition protein [Halanaerobium congolense]|uniref:Chromosome partitioning protein, ParB family n=1 Tax=Halanaerobium congolense TaxID=54121 RepID=A0A1G6IL42_9FIRM|nr:ParB/RepB/Spo0J family partition protein [Halanaerobium congolense]KXS50383.1 MAG: chromosome partitioning protein, ParB family [Halanaerobium sp. T82-1]OEG62077.1 MAG: chromosome partitioning protein ParB [Halanaerobium sp. MDAL1]PUU92358.1 MAG: chromosome partitioning protein, ParB family [Halanaerobium sp.]PTX15941.1 ParB family chromosome partitioning protein [Halanaerobium congolense]PXV64534.1 ParB family chromosome partitioning protein [Halanaerobium congolense]